MCTALSYPGKRHYFGRNLDLEYSFHEEVVVTQRNYPFHFRCGITLQNHHAMIGIATVSENYPLYYESTNEFGLSIAALNFPGNAKYLPKTAGIDNIAPFELIPWVLGQCKSTQEARNLLSRVSIWHLPFSRRFPLSPLHWIISDKQESIVAEPMGEGLCLYENPLGILTNSPPFPYHLQHLADFSALRPDEPDNRFLEDGILQYSNGMGAMGLPGDFSSASRFIRAAFVRKNSVSEGSEISQFFHLLASVSMPAGSVQIGRKNEITRYSSCCDTENGLFYYTTYENSRITGIDMHKCHLTGCNIITYPLRDQPDILFEN